MMTTKAANLISMMRFLERFHYLNLSFCMLLVCLFWYSVVPSELCFGAPLCPRSCVLVARCALGAVFWWPVVPSELCFGAPLCPRSCVLVARCALGAALVPHCALDAVK